MAEALTRAAAAAMVRAMQARTGGDWERKPLALTRRQAARLGVPDGQYDVLHDGPIPRVPRG